MQRSMKIPRNQGRGHICLSTGSLFFPFLFLLSTHQDGVRSVDGDLVIGGVAARQPQVEVLDVKVDIRQNKLALDVVPVYT